MCFFGGFKVPWWPRGHQGTTQRRAGAYQHHTPHKRQPLGSPRATWPKTDGPTGRHTRRRALGVARARPQRRERSTTRQQEHRRSKQSLEREPHPHLTTAIGAAHPELRIKLTIKKVRSASERRTRCTRLLVPSPTSKASTQPRPNDIPTPHSPHSVARATYTAQRHEYQRATSSREHERTGRLAAALR